MDTLITYLNLEVMEASVALISLVLHCLQLASVYSVVLFLKKIFFHVLGRFSVNVNEFILLHSHRGESNKPTNVFILLSFSTVYFVRDAEC